MEITKNENGREIYLSNEDIQLYKEIINSNEEIAIELVLLAMIGDEK